MKTLNFSLMNIQFQIKAPFECIMNEPLRPFLVSDDTVPDVWVSFQPVDCLPGMKDGIWIEDMFFSENCVFVRNQRNEPAYAMVEFEENTVICKYLSQFERYVCHIDSILNLIGMEAIFLRNNGILLHSSLIRVNGKAVLFTAPCGTGKSTQASLWEKYLGADILNGDRAGLRCVDGVWTAFGMPFAGTSGIYRNESAPVSAIVALAQGQENVVRRIYGVQVLRKILPEISSRRWDQNFMNRLFSLLSDMIESIPVYFLECRPDLDAVQTLYNELAKEEML